MINLDKDNIMGQSRHQFLYRKVDRQIEAFLKGLEADFPIRDGSSPVAIYIKSEELISKDTNANKDVGVIILKARSREQLSITIAEHITSRLLEIEDKLNESNITEFLRVMNRCLLTPKEKPMKTLRELKDRLSKSSEFYKDPSTVQESPLNRTDSIIPFVDTNMFAHYAKELLKMDSYFGVIIDHQNPISKYTYQAINGIVNMRCNGDISMKIATSPEAWLTYQTQVGDIIDATHDYETVDLDGSLKKQTEQNKKNYAINDVAELGGFAERPEDIDGTEEDLEAFNYCLADEYFTAMVNEDFDSLGEIDSSLLQDINYWLCYNQSLDPDAEGLYNLIPQGLFKTYQGRTFAESAIATKNGNVARALIGNGNREFELYMTVLLNENALDKEDGTLNSLLAAHSQDVDTFCTALEAIFSRIGKTYEQIESDEEKIAFLQLIKPYIAGIRIPVEYKDSVKLTKIAKMQSAEWQIQLKRI